jgi:hypothetical protein
MKFAMLAMVGGALLLAGNVALYAQAVYGSLYGTVIDPSGAVVSGATVTVTDVEKGTVQSAATNGSGSWTVDHLIPDTYIVKVVAATFSSSQTDPIEVHADASQKLDISVSAAGSTQTVNVTTEAPFLKTDRADVSQILDERTIANLPNLTRNFTSFLLLTPGVQHSSFNIAGPENPQGGLALNTNGSNYGEQGFLLDGTDNRDPVLGIIVLNPTLDSISETKVTTQNYDAELGGAAGGIVSVSTKSGGNVIHGDAFLFRHSDALYARNPFTQFAPDPISGRTIPSELYSQFGGSVSGPLRKDRSFFFLDYQALRNRVGNTFFQNIPTAAVQSSCVKADGTGVCNLTAYAAGLPLYNPVTKLAYTTPVGTIPFSAVSSQAKALLTLLPLPNVAGAGITNNYAASGNGQLNSDQADIRLDQQFGQKVHSFGRYDYAVFRLLGVPAFGSAGGNGFGLGNTTGNTVTQNQSATIGADYAVKPSLLTDIRLGFLSYHVSENKYAGLTSAAALGIVTPTPVNTVNPADTLSLPTFNFANTLSGLGSQGCNCPLTQSEQVFQLTNNWTKNLGNHAIKFGADLRYAKNVRNASDNNRAGLFTFADATTSSSTGAGGSDLAAFLIGDAAQFQRFDVYIDDQYSYQKRGAIYVQDTWRVTPKLTMNYGVRWDIIFPETVNGAGHGGFASIASGGIRVAGVAGIGTNGNENTDFKNIAPRFGIAYQVTPSTVLRAGGGQTYDTVGYFGTLFGSALSHNLPVQADESIGNTNNAAANAFATTLASPPAVPSQPTIPSNGIIPFSDNIGESVRPQTITLPRVDQFNVAVQQQLGSSSSFEIAYVGNIGERVYPGETFGEDLNQYPLPRTPADIAAGTSVRRPYYEYFHGTYNGTATICCSNSIGNLAPNGRATYNGLQTKFDKRFSRGLSFNANYTWSKATNFGSDAAFGIASQKHISYGRNDTNRAQIFVLSSVYALPFGRGKQFLGSSNRLVDTFVGGYSLAGQTTWESGRPFTPTYAECGSDQDVDNNFGNSGATSDCRPNGNASSLNAKAGALNPLTHARTYFAPVAALTTNGAVSGPFSRPAFGTFGNVGRNSLVGPRDYFADLSVIKAIPMTERIKGEFQVQAFNVFNHAELDAPNSNNSHCIDCTVAQGAGVITSLEGNSTMRRIQFAVRVTF